MIPRINNNIITPSIITSTIFKRLSSTTIPEPSSASTTLGSEEDPLQNSTTPNKSKLVSKRLTKKQNRQNVEQLADLLLRSAGTEQQHRYNLGSLPRVPPTSNINNAMLFNDMLMNSHMPLLSPVQKNHTLSTKKRQNSVLESLLNFKQQKSVQLSRQRQNSNYYNTYLNKDKLRLPYNSIFCNTALNTQQHNLEMFNLPLNYLEKLKPFTLINKPGDEYYRDDLIVLSKIELEEMDRAKKLKLEKKLAKEGRILDLEAFFGFK